MPAVASSITRLPSHLLPQAMDDIPRPKVVRLDPNDPQLIVGIPEEPEAREHEVPRDGKKVSCACGGHVMVM